MSKEAASISAHAFAIVARLGCGAAILSVIVWRWGAEPFLAALESIDAVSLAVAVVVTGLTTVCCAWRWSLVAGGLGVHVRLRPALAAYYRSQFLNLTLPGGVVGDAHRGVRHGRDVGSVGRSLRSVVWERTFGQIVQVVLTASVLVVVPTPVRSAAIVALLAAAVGIGVVVAARAMVRARPAIGPTPGRVRAAVRASMSDLRAIARARAVPGIVVASMLVVVGHVVVFMVAMSAVGVDTVGAHGVPVALIVLQAAAIPANLAGWGPREGVAAWAFGSVGLGAAQGVSVAVLYGVLALGATLPGAVLLIAGHRRVRRGRTGDVPAAAAAGGATQ
ncbi:MAG: flippase-like domain-containing protein [Actinomycetia bacterium]|nr:flippase-like domain-containing protein [Actinomycetes bacterium]